ncbi:MAG: outer membrane lipoprotein carrier protein LolA, partial [Pseudomonadota bacterium]
MAIDPAGSGNDAAGMRRKGSREAFTAQDSMDVTMNRRSFLLAGSVGVLVSAEPALAQELSGAEARDLARISNYLNGTETLQGQFVQVGPDGDLSTGTFFLRRPGRVRFEYDLPNPTLIVADGTWVGVTNRQSETLDRY